jgi:hypothetical protein
MASARWVGDPAAQGKHKTALLKPSASLFDLLSRFRVKVCISVVAMHAGARRLRRFLVAQTRGESTGQEIARGEAA